MTPEPVWPRAFAPRVASLRANLDETCCNSVHCSRAGGNELLAMALRAAAGSAQELRSSRCSVKPFANHEFANHEPHCQPPKLPRRLRCRRSRPARRSASAAARPAVRAEIDCIIVGAGAAGIAAARRLAAAGRSFMLVEASNRIGGRCFTETQSFGVPFDRGAHLIHNAGHQSADQARGADRPRHLSGAVRPAHPHRPAQRPRRRA